MLKRKSNIRIRISSKNFSYLILSLVLLLFSTNASSFNSHGFGIASLSMSFPQALNISIVNPVVVLFLALLIICILIIFYSVKIKRVTRELQEKNKQIHDFNNNLQSNDKEHSIREKQISGELYKSDKLFEVLLKTATDGISFFDKEWNLIFANNEFYSSIGLDKDAYSALNRENITHPDDHDYESKREKALMNEGHFESEIKLKHKDGNYLCFLIRSVAVKSDTGEVLGTLNISRDITKLKKANEDLSQANVEVEASSNLKSSFLANISHEIRTPLNSVVGFSNLLLADNLTSEVKEEYIEHINYNSEKLLQIIGDIIDLSRLESSQIEIAYEEASLSDIVNEVIEDARLVIRRNEKSIILNVKNQFEDIGDLIFTDKIWLKRVLSHLMDNAVKFTLDGSVEFSYLLENENIVFKIKDTGIGINKDNLGRIFEEFKQEIDGHHRPFEGLGIGLTLAKEVVERMGGNIYVKSEKGIGSEFSFSLPYRPAGSTKLNINNVSSDQVSTAINWVTRKCLLVDDNKDVLIYLKRILIDSGIEIITARSGFEAIELIKNTPDLDLVLLDMQMPEMNGIEATKEIRKIRKDLPIIAQTAFIFEDDKDIIIEAGCDACLIKPIRKDHLLTVMSGFIKSN